MFIRWRESRHQLFVDLVANHRTADGPRIQYLGRLGSVRWSESKTGAAEHSISVAERTRFWIASDESFRKIDAQHPGLLTRAELDKLILAIDRRIPQARTAAEREVFFKALVVRDAMAALDRAEQGEDAMAEARKRLKALSAEERRAKRRREKQEG